MIFFWIDLEQEEMLMLEEKNERKMHIQAIKSEKAVFEAQKDSLIAEIEQIRQNSILVRCKNDIYESKLQDILIQLSNINNRREHLFSLSEEHNLDSSKKSHPLSNATATFLGRRNTDTDNSNNSNTNSNAKLPTINEPVTNRSQFSNNEFNISYPKNSSRSSKSAYTQRSEGNLHQLSSETEETKQE